MKNLLIFISIFIITFNVWGQEFKTPKLLSKYLLENIKYQKEPENMPYDYWQNPKETFELKSGDCEDISFFTNFTLKKWGYESKVYGIVFYNPKIAHAITIFKTKNNCYKIFDNQHLICGCFKNPITAIKKVYANIEMIYEVIPIKYGKVTESIKFKSIKIIYRRKK